MAGLSPTANPKAAVETNLETGDHERNPLRDKQGKTMAAIFQQGLVIPLGAQDL
jgi:hypothetical protein